MKDSFHSSQLSTVGGVGDISMKQLHNNMYLCFQFQYFSFG